MLDSGPRDNPDRETKVVFEEVMFLGADVPWVRVHFAEANLPPGSKIRVSSQLDGESQTLDAAQLAQWGNGTAFFNGPAVRVELLAGANTVRNQLAIRQLLAGERGGEPLGTGFTMCGELDARRPAIDPRIGRLLDGSIRTPGEGLVSDGDHCSAFIIEDGVGLDKLHLTAGHCIGISNPVAIDPRVSEQYDFPLVLQFDVSQSKYDCTPIHPPVESQFAVDNSSLIYGTEPADFSVFRCFPNADPVTHAPKTTYQHSGLRAFTRGAVPTIYPYHARIPGFGRDGNEAATTPDGPASCFCSYPLGSCTPTTCTGRYHLTLQSATGAGYDPSEFSSAIVAGQFPIAIDACPGNSGSPIINQPPCPTGLECPGTVPCVHAILDDISTCSNGICPEGFRCVTQSGQPCTGGGTTCFCDNRCPTGNGDCVVGVSCITAEGADCPNGGANCHCDRRCPTGGSDCVCDIHDWNSPISTFTGSAIGITIGGSCQTTGVLGAFPTSHSNIQSAIDWLTSVVLPGTNIIAPGSRYLRIIPGGWPYASVEVNSAFRIVGLGGLPTCLDAYLQTGGTLGAMPVYRTQSEWGGVLFVGNEDIVPSAEENAVYQVIQEFDPNVVLPEDPPAPRDLGAATTRLWGDLTDIPAPGMVDVDDLLCMLSAFAGDFTPDCTFYAADMANCHPNGVIDVDDLFAFLEAYNGQTYEQYAEMQDPQCELPCDLRALSGTRDLPPSSLAKGSALFELIPREESAAPGEFVTIDIFLSNASEVRCFQVALDLCRGTTCDQRMDQIVIDSRRPDYVFPTEGDSVSAVDVHRGRAVACLRTGSLAALKKHYLGTFTKRVPLDATAFLSVGMRNGATHLRNSAGHPVAYAEVQQVAIRIGEPKSKGE